MIRHWARVVNLEKGIVLFTLRRDDGNPEKAMLSVEADIGSFVEGADFGIVRMVLADLNYDNLDETFLPSYADAQRAKDAVKMMIVSWEQVKQERLGKAVH